MIENEHPGNSMYVYHGEKCKENTKMKQNCTLQNALKLKRVYSSMTF